MTGTETARRVINSAWLFFLQVGGWLLHGAVVALVLIVKVVEVGARVCRCRVKCKAVTLDIAALLVLIHALTLVAILPS